MMGFFLHNYYAMNANDESKNENDKPKVKYYGHIYSAEIHQSELTPLVSNKTYDEYLQKLRDYEWLSSYIQKNIR